MFGRFKIRLSKSWPVQTVKRPNPRYVCISRRAHKAPSYYHCVVLYLHLAKLREQKQYPIGFMVSSCCFWSRTRPICTAQAWVSSERCPYALGCASPDYSISEDLRVSIAANLVSLRRRHFANWSLRTCLFGGTAI